MSGGVDSSVAAALLKQQGYGVTGVFIKIDVGTDCNWREERRDAMRAAAKLGLPFAIFDLSDAYRKSVLDYLVNEYRLGRTPNPDVMCNKQIKFGEFFNEACLRQGADFIATGHYARIRRPGDFSAPGRRGEVAIKSPARLLAALDDGKDQTYFLWTIKPEVLARCLFPIGDYQKSEVRKLARKFDLSNAEKPDSQGLCFLGQIDFKNFLAEQLPGKVGQVLNEKGQVIGEHRGAHLYTIGERHGFKVSRRLTLSADKAVQLPHYIVAKDVTKNTITVATRPVVWATKEIKLSETNWISDIPQNGKMYQTRMRHRAPLVAGHVFVEAKDNTARVIFDEPQAGLAPGQSCVIYDAEVCLGGGVINLI